MPLTMTRDNKRNKKFCIVFTMSAISKLVNSFRFSFYFPCLPSGETTLIKYYKKSRLDP